MPSSSPSQTATAQFDKSSPGRHGMEQLAGMYDHDKATRSFRLAFLADMALGLPHPPVLGQQVRPFETLDHLAQQYDSLLDTPGELDIKAIASLAATLQQLVQRYPELALGMSNLMDIPSPARRHALHVATVGILLARELGLPEEARLTVACAALTMNVSSYILQDRLCQTDKRPGTEDQIRLRMHAWHSAETLVHLGVNDARWLLAVSQHHENLDGSGYPFGVAGDAITREARILHTADVWCALLSQRPKRLCLPPRQALRDLFQRERGKLEDASMLALRRVMGYYPPGTLVRLANEEVAMVTRWFGLRGRPDYVVSLLKAGGTPVSQPQIRHTSQPAYAIRNYTCLPLEHMSLDWPGVWALA